MSSVMLALGLVFSQEASNTLDTLETVVYIRFFSLLGIATLLLFTKSKIFLTKKSIPILFFQGKWNFSIRLFMLLLLIWRRIIDFLLLLLLLISLLFWSSRASKV